MQILHTALIVLALLIILIVMLQSKGTGLSIVPGANDFGKFERRGAELTLHRITIGMVALFIVLSIISYLFA